MPDELIVFGAEMETQGFDEGATKVLKGLDAMKQSNIELQKINEGLKATNKELGTTLEGLKDQTSELLSSNKNLSATNKELNKDYSFQEKQLKAIEKEMKGLDEKTDKGITRIRQLKTEYKTLKADMAGTAQQMIKNSSAIQQNTDKIRANEVATKSMTKEVKANSEALKVNEVSIKDTTKKIADLEKAGGKASQAVGKLWGGLRTLANVLPGLGIAGLIGLITDFAVAMFQAGQNLDSLTGKRKLWNQVNAEAAEAASKDIAKLELFRVKLNDLSISEKERIKIAGDYNKIADEQNKIDTTQINNLALINKAIDEQTRLIIARSVAVAATGKLAPFADKAVEAQLRLGTRAAELGIPEEKFKQQVTDAFKRRNEFVNKILNTSGAERGRLIKEQKKSGIDELIKASLGGMDAEDIVVRAKETQDELQKAAGILGKLISPEAFTKTGGGGGEIENVFQQKLAELRTRLATTQLAEFQSEPLIQNKFEEQLQKEFLEIGKLLKDKKLTIPQADILKGLIKQINEIELSKSLEEFRQKQRDAVDKVNQIIFDSNLEASNKRIANIRDEFDREQQTIEQNFQVATEALAKKLADLQKNINADVKKGLLTEEQGAEKNAILQAIFGDLLTEAGQARINAHLELSFKMFQATLKEGKRLMELELLNMSEGATGAIQLETSRFTAGTIKYEEYQKRITKILKDEARERKKIQLQELNDELSRLQTRLDQTSDAGQRKALEDQQRGVRGQIVTLSRDIAGDDAGAKKEQDEINKKRVEAIIAYANAINGLLSQIAGFWQQVNAVEQAALDRSIALQEKRVENAKEIAEKGNAEYLEQEQKRLDELERKREENAQKQIAINNALTASQAIVAMISAIAQATASGSPIAAIGAVAATIGAIAAAYAFVNSLQPQSSQFYEGEEYVDQPGRPRGKDTIPARLNIGERVVTTEKNQKYWDTLSAIHNGTIPADVLNNFVNAYGNGVPMVDFMRLNDATSGKIGFDSMEVARKLDTTNDRLGEVIEAVASIAINLKMDSDGFAGSVSSYLNKMHKKKNA